MVGAEIEGDEDEDYKNEVLTALSKAEMGEESEPTEERQKYKVIYVLCSLFGTMNVIIPPEGLSLQGNAADNFRKWRQRFEVYFQASGLSTDTSVIYNTFSLSEEDSRNYVKILKILEQHFIPTAIQIVVRCVFFSCVQQEGESFDAFVTELRKLSADCKSGDLRDSLIRDHIICCIRDVRVKDRLLREPNLDLLKCINISHAVELADIQTRVKFLEYRRPRLHPVKQRVIHKVTKYIIQVLQEGVCEMMLASSKETTQVSRRQVIAVVSHSVRHVVRCTYGASAQRTVNSVINVVSTIIFRWWERVSLNTHDIPFKLNTGAQVNIITKNICTLLQLDIVCTQVKLLNYNGGCIDAIGEMTTKAIVIGSEYFITFVVVDIKATCILGLPTIVKMNLLSRVDAVNVRQSNSVTCQYPHLSQGIGELDYVYTIKLKDHSVPVAEPPRKIPFKFQERVKIEVDRMEEIGVIRKVTEPKE
ncbi:hypothetical protein PR048_029307 [Dryococelus australis]|uniref:Uncharacterized protein n=1 Tax=Dryococelus australis TaxID=614101 RepID=A0ABQ9GG42_9NEOP|nr:hypothetical protein PR048_029307 [Dryococelus australis]